MKTIREIVEKHIPVDPGMLFAIAVGVTPPAASFTITNDTKQEMIAELEANTTSEAVASLDDMTRRLALCLIETHGRYDSKQDQARAILQRMSL